MRGIKISNNSNVSSKIILNKPQKLYQLCMRVCFVSFSV